MRCPSCNHESAASTRFCVQCGARIDGTGNAPPASATPATAATKSIKPHRHGCRRGCLVVFVLLLVLLCVTVAVLFDVPRRMGLIPSHAERLLSGPPDRLTAGALLADFQRAGQPTNGLSVYVLPVKDTKHTLAYIILDPACGYHFVNTGQDNPVLAAFVTVARSKNATDVGRVAVEFRNVTGETLFVMTAPVEAIRRFADGVITRQQFFAKTDGRGDLSKVISIQLDALRGGK